MSCRCPKPGWFVGDPTPLARDNILTPLKKSGGKAKRGNKDTHLLDPKGGMVGKVCTPQSNEENSEVYRKSGGGA